jgi:hypothetical protein
MRSGYLAKVLVEISADLNEVFIDSCLVHINASPRKPLLLLRLESA